MHAGGGADPCPGESPLLRLVKGARLPARGPPQAEGAATSCSAPPSPPSAASDGASKGVRNLLRSYARLDPQPERQALGLQSRAHGSRDSSETVRASLTQGHKAGCDTLTCFSPAGSRAPLPPAEPGRQASARRAADAWVACTPREGPDGGRPRSAATGDRGRALTSAGRLGKAGAMPFSALTLPELLLGELGAEPGALLHESAGERRREPRAPRPGRPSGAGYAGHVVTLVPLLNFEVTSSARRGSPVHFPASPERGPPTRGLQQGPVRWRGCGGRPTAHAQGAAQLAAPETRTALAGRTPDLLQVAEGTGGPPCLWGPGSL